MQRNITSKCENNQMHGNDENMFILANINSYNTPIDESKTLFPIRLRKRNDYDLSPGNESKPIPNFKPLSYIERDLNNEDTLQSVALKYNCNIGELKRLNNIQLDNEAFCKGKIRIPINVYNISIIEKEKEEYLKDLNLKKQSLKLSLKLGNLDKSINGIVTNQGISDASLNNLSSYNSFLTDTNSIINNIKTPAEEYLANVDAAVNFYSQKLSPFSNLDLIAKMSPERKPNTSLICQNIDEHTNLLNSDCHHLIASPKVGVISSEASLTSNFLHKENIHVIKRNGEKCLCLPSECGMKLWVLLLLMLLVCIAVPVLILWHFINLKNHELDE